MKNIALSVFNHVRKNFWLYFWCLWWGFSTYTIVRMGVKTNTAHANELAESKAETERLRGKINNYLMATGFYEKPAKQVLPVMRDFGIQP